MSLGGSYGRRPGPGLGAWAALGALGLLVGLAVALFIVWPRLVSTFPPAGAQFVSSRSPIRLSFNGPMDQASVEAALKTTPGLPGSLAWEGNTLSFIPADSWPLSTTVTVSLAGARSQRGLPLLGANTWTFTVGERRLAYLAGAPTPNLWLTTVSAGAAPQALTQELVGVYDFAISPDGTRVAYAARRADGGADLKLINIDGSGLQDLAACAGDACISPMFSPDGARLAYQRHALVSGPGGEVSFGESQVYLHTLGAGGEDTVVSDGAGRFPHWGPDGRLAYLDTNRQAIAVLDLAGGGVTYVPNTSGEMGTWSPDGVFIVFPEIIIPPEPTHAPGQTEEPEASTPFYSYLLRVNIATNEPFNLSGEGVVDDASPVYSPSGGWLAFGRKLQVDGQWSPGRQVWLMRPDGSEAHPLTADPLYNQSAFTWSTDGGLLAYMRFNTNDPGEPAEIWLIDVDTAGEAPAAGAEGGPRRLAQGYLPDWLP
jgi:Tol biopolymer transport system component